LSLPQKTPMTTSDTTSRPRTYRDYWQASGGEKLTTLTRLLLFIPLIAILQKSHVVWPPAPTSEPVVLLLWGYLGFGILMSVLLLIPPIGSLSRHLYVLDVVLLVVLAVLSENIVLFFPFLLVPLLSAAAYQAPLLSLLSGLLTAAAYGSVFYASWDGPEFPTFPLMVQVLMLLFLPWVSINLTRQWASVNQRTIAAAEAHRDEALEQAQFYQEQMRSFSNVTAKLAETVNYKQVTTIALQEIQKLLPQSRTGLILLPTGNPKELKIESVEPANPSVLGSTITTGNGTIGGMLRASSTACIVENIGHEPEAESLPMLQSYSSAALSPLRMKLKTFGILIVLSDQPDAFTSEHLEMLQGIANYIIVAIYNAQMQFEMKQGHSRLLAKEKEVRDNIASKLHDGPTQKVAQISMNTDFIKKVAQNDPSRLPEELDKFAQLAQVANSEMRMTLFELRPLTLETQGLRAALDEYVEKLKIRSGKTQVLVRSRGSLDTALEREAESVIFDIVQESVNNALKHAEASQIKISLERQDTQFVTTVSDDGKGFDPEAARESAAKRASFGLQNFNERAEMIGGTVEIDAAPGKGSTIRIIVPLSNTA
jgi:signal transduction histidine kinase